MAGSFERAARQILLLTAGYKPLAVLGL